MIKNYINNLTIWKFCKDVLAVFGCLFSMSPIILSQRYVFNFSIVIKINFDCLKIVKTLRNIS